MIKMVMGLERISCSALEVETAGLNTVRITNNPEWEEVRTKKHPSLSITKKSEDKVPVYTATLKFYTCEDLDDCGYYAYKVKLADGSYRLIGMGERPFPVTVTEETMPEKPTDNQLNLVTVTWSVPRNIPYII